MPIDRSAILLRHRQPYIDWVKSQDPSAQPPFDVHERPVYLLPAADTNEQAKSVLRRYCRVIFELELDAWTSDRSIWPKDLTYKNFLRWFEVENNSLIFDLVAGDHADEEE